MSGLEDAFKGLGDQINDAVKNLEGMMPTQEQIEQMTKDATASLSEDQQAKLTEYQAAITAGTEPSAEQKAAFEAFSEKQADLKDQWLKDQSGAFATAVAGAFAAFTFLF